MQRDFSGVGYRKEGKALALFGTFGMRFLDWLLHNVAWTFSFSLLGSLTVAACKQIVQAFDIMAGPCEMENVLSVK